MSLSDKPWLVAVSAGRWQLHGIRAAMAAGLRVLAIDGDPGAPGLRMADAGCVTDIRDPLAVLAAVENSGIYPDGAISFVSEVGMPAVAALRERYDLPGPRRDLTEIMTNKACQRQLWERAGVPNPRWQCISSLDEARDAIASIGLPAVIKPTDSAGSRGVTRLDSVDQLAKAFDKAMKASRNKQLVVEAFIEGIECTVETFGCDNVNHVLAVTQKTKVPGTGGTVASELRTPESQALETVAATAAREALAALGYLEGPGHTEVIVDARGRPWLVEAAGRGGGFMIFDRMIELASGYDVATATALQAIGRLPRPPINLARNWVVLRFFPSRSGTLREIHGFEQANAIAGVEAGPFVRVGDRTGGALADADRLGYILAVAEGPAEAKAAADHAESLVGFIIE